MSPMRMFLPRLVAAILAALTLSAAVATTASADTTQIPGSLLTIHVGERGQLQAFRAGQESGIFFPSLDTTGDAGFFLAFPDATQPGLTGTVYGFEGAAGPSGLTEYTPVSQGLVTGSGSASDPLTQVTAYSAGADVLVEQTTRYVNGSQQFSVQWDVTNDTGTALKFKALAAADFFFEGSDRGTGIFTQGPPRFIGGTNADSGNSGGFEEVLGAPLDSPPWSAYQALAYGSSPEEVWGKVQSAAASPAASFDNTVVGEPVDNAGGVEWGQFETTALADGETATFALNARNAVPAALQISPSNAGSPQAVPINFTVTGLDTNGQPYAGRTLRYEIRGANPGAGSVTTNAGGQAVVTDAGANPGADTVIVYLDFNNNGTREPVEPQASALATFLDNVAPSCSVKVSGDRPGGGGAGKPLVITVNCNEQATVTVQTTLRPLARASADKRKKHKKKRKKKVVIKLKSSTVTVGPGQALPVSIKLPGSVRKKYAGKTLRATIVVTARDSTGNVKKTTATRTIKLAKAKHKKKHRKRGD